MSEEEENELENSATNSPTYSSPPYSPYYHPRIGSPSYSPFPSYNPSHYSDMLPPYSVSSHEQYIEKIEEIIMNKKVSFVTIENLCKQITKEGTAKVIQDFVKLSEKQFPSFVTSTIVKKMFVIACGESNYEKMDFLFSLLGGKKIGRFTLDRILSSIRCPTTIYCSHFHSNILKLFKYLEDKGLDDRLDIKNPPKMLTMEFLYCSFKDCSYGKLPIEEKEQFELIKYLLNKFPHDFNHVRKYGGIIGKSLMQCALESRNLKLIKYFLSMGIGSITEKFDDQNALYFSLQNVWRENDKEQEKSLFKVVKYLVEKGVNIHECDKNGVTVLHLSAQFHTLEMIKYFISLGVNLHSLDHQNNNTLLYAFKRYTCYFKKKKDETTEEYSARYSKIRKRGFKIIKYLINEGINIEQRNDDGMDAFLSSIKWANFELIKFIADLIPSLKTQKTFKQGANGAIYHSLKSLNVEIFKYLDQFPFFANYFDGKNEIITNNNILFDLIDWYIRKYEIIFCKDFKKFKEVFDFFLNRRNNINCINNSGYIPLQHIVYLQYFVFSVGKYRKYLLEII